MKATRLAMTAAVVPFPLVRRRNFIARQATRASELTGDAAERHIQSQIKIQAAAMRRKGIREVIITREIRSMEFAIRSMLARAVSGGIS
jgi:hypothetical protein